MFQNEKDVNGICRFNVIIPMKFKKIIKVKK